MMTKPQQRIPSHHDNAQPTTMTTKTQRRRPSHYDGQCDNKQFMLWRIRQRPSHNDDGQTTKTTTKRITRKRRRCWRLSHAVCFDPFTSQTIWELGAGMIIINDVFSWYDSKRPNEAPQALKATTSLHLKVIALHAIQLTNHIHSSSLFSSKPPNFATI